MRGGVARRQSPAPRRIRGSDGEVATGQTRERAGLQGSIAHVPRELEHLEIGVDGALEARGREHLTEAQQHFASFQGLVGLLQEVARLLEIPPRPIEVAAQAVEVRERQEESSLVGMEPELHGDRAGAFVAATGVVHATPGEQLVPERTQGVESGRRGDVRGEDLLQHPRGRVVLPERVEVDRDVEPDLGQRPLVAAGLGEMQRRVPARFRRLEVTEMETSELEPRPGECRLGGQRSVRRCRDHPLEEARFLIESIQIETGVAGAQKGGARQRRIRFATQGRQGALLARERLVRKAHPSSRVAELDPREQLDAPIAGGEGLAHGRSEIVECRRVPAASAQEPAASIEVSRGSRTVAAREGAARREAFALDALDEAGIPLCGRSGLQRKKQSEDCQHELDDLVGNEWRIPREPQGRPGQARTENARIWGSAAPAAMLSPLSMSPARQKKSVYGVHPGVKRFQDWIETLPGKTGRSLAEWLALIRRDAKARG